MGNMKVPRGTNLPSRQLQPPAHALALLVLESIPAAIRSRVPSFLNGSRPTALHYFPGNAELALRLVK